MSDFPKCYGIIPARYQSTRFPGKPLADILGRPMIWHVYERARQCADLTSVFLATDDDRIRSVAEEWNIPVIMTRADHPSGTDRVLEAATKLNLSIDSVVVNIQGDEPALEPAMLTALQVTTLARKINAAEAANPDLVKIVFTKDGRALYFSRSSIPHHRNAQKNHYYGHIGIYAFRMKALNNFVALNQSRLEITEKLEQLRLLEHSIPIQIIVTEHQSISVDRPEDINSVSKIIARKNQNQPRYG